MKFNVKNTEPIPKTEPKHTNQLVIKNIKLSAFRTERLKIITFGFHYWN